MRTLLALFALLVLVSPLALIIRQTQDNDHSQKGHIERLIEQLGAPTFVEREAAEKELRAIGRDAMESLRAASRDHDDPEIRFRATRAGTSILMNFDQCLSIDLSLVAIPLGEYEMGSPADEPDRMTDELQHPISITQPFLLGIHEVTQAQYLQVMELNPSWFQAEGEGADLVAEFDTAQFPVENVSWFDAIAFCNQLSRDEGDEPYYQMTSIEREGLSIRSASVEVLGGSGYRLPTEAEWEHACRARSRAAFSFGSRGLNGNRSNIKGVTRSIGYGGVEKGISLDRTTAVGSYAANEFGVYDMHGNVAEWCWDWYSSEYELQKPGQAATGPEQGDQRTVRGGSWLLGEARSRSASRMMQAPEELKYTTGFRVVRSW